MRISITINDLTPDEAREIIWRAQDIVKPEPEVEEAPQPVAEEKPKKTSAKKKKKEEPVQQEAAQEPVTEQEEKTEPQPAEEITLDKVRAETVAAISSKGRNAVASLFPEFGVEKVTGLKPEQFAQFLKRLKEV